MRWARVTVSVRPEAVEAVSARLWELGARGVVTGEPHPATGEIAASAYFSLPNGAPLYEYKTVRDLGAFVASLPLYGLEPGSGEITVHPVAEEDWAEAWKAHFHPVRVGRHLVVRPSWEDYTPEPGDIVLEIDPGMAFGTGTHATTATCMACLEDYMRPGMRVCDAGCGSGILSVTAALLGAERVLAVDMEEEACVASAENAARNGVAEAVRVTCGDAVETLARNRAEFDLVVANILAEFVLEHAGVMAGAVAPDGVVIAGGIVESKEEACRAALTATGLAVLEDRRQEGWVTLVAAKSTGT